MRFAGMGLRTGALAACLTLLAACESGGGTGSPRPESMTSVSTLDQTGVPGAAVAAPPSVRVLDQSGRPIAGVTVQFAVTAGGGTLTGASPTTNAQGIATVGSWVLGPNPGLNSVSATVSGLVPMTFTAQAADPCDLLPAYQLFSTVNGNLSTTDCQLSTGEYIDFFSVNFPTASAVQFRLSSNAIDPFLYLANAAGNIVAINDDNDAADELNSVLRVYAPSGNYLVAPSSFDPDEVGAYQLSSTQLTGGNQNCLEYWVVPGVAISGQLATTDCDLGTAGPYGDFYLVVLRAGQRLVVRHESPTLDTFLELYNGNFDLVDSDDDSAGNLNALIDYTAPATDVYFILATDIDAATGTYTLTVTNN